MIRKHSPLMVPALRAKMGTWIYYVSFMKMRDISERISMVKNNHSDEYLQYLSQQKLENRSNYIAEYLLSQDQRFLNSLVVGICGGNPQWYELEIEYPNSDDEQMMEELEGTIGILKLDGSETLFALDGQHHVDGIRKAIVRNLDLATEKVSVIFVSGVIAKYKQE